MELRYISLILMYLLGIMGIYTIINFFYRWIRYGENQLVELYRYPSADEMNSVSLGQMLCFSLSRLAKQIFVIGMIPIVGFDVFIVILDSMLWLNRELGLNFAFLAGWYGPNMEIWP